MEHDGDYDATMSAMEAASAAHRAVHPVPADPVPLAIARNAARTEALTLLHGRTGTAREIHIASMLATADREASDGQLSARHLEDSFHDHHDTTTRRGSIAMAGMLLSSRTIRPKGPSIDRGAVPAPRDVDRGR